MKFPKLKHGFLCELILCLPLFGWIFVVFVCAIISDIPEWLSTAVIIYLIVRVIFVLVYLWKNLMLMLTGAAMTGIVRAWKNARMYYETDCNGKDRKTAEDKILRRMKKRGRACEVCVSEITPIAVRRSCRYCLTTHYRAIEKICMLYSVDKLDEKTYQTIMTSAKRNIQKTHRNPEYAVFEEKEQRKAPVAASAAVIILADCISGEIPELVMKKQSSPVSEMLVCVGDMSNQKYYYDAVCEVHIPGTTEKPEKNFAADTVRRIVFKGRLPLQGNDNYVLLTEEHKRAQELSETVLWDFIREFRKEMADADKEQEKVAKSLSENEVRVIDEEIYCRLGENVTLSPIETEDGKITVQLTDLWRYPKKKRISKKDMKSVRLLMESHLQSEGYTVKFSEFEKGE